MFGNGNGGNAFIGGSGADLFYNVQGSDQISGVNAGDRVVKNDPPPIPPSPDSTVVLSTSDVNQLLERAAAASASNDAIIAIVDRDGNILGVRVESGVAPAITGNDGILVFAIDGAVAEARTGAFFANDQAPLTSRTIQFISQSTITQREVDSNPNIPDPNSTVHGPGFVAPIGIGGHFPPGVLNTPQVDLFDIEHTNRDCHRHQTAGRGPLQHPARRRSSPACATSAAGLLRLQCVCIETLPTTRNRAASPRCPAAFRSTRTASWSAASASSSPAQTGFATEENSSLSTSYDPTQAGPSLEAEYIAFRGGRRQSDGQRSRRHSRRHRAGRRASTCRSAASTWSASLCRFRPGGGVTGRQTWLQVGAALWASAIRNSGIDAPVDPPAASRCQRGKPVPDGWLATPHAGSGPGVQLTAADVTQIINQGIAQANQTRAAIRLPLGEPHAAWSSPSPTTQGNVLGLYRMPDAHGLLDRRGRRQGAERRLLRRPGPAPAARPGARHPGRRRVHQPHLPLPGRAALSRKGSTARRRGRSRSSTTAASTR